MEIKAPMWVSGWRPPGQRLSWDMGTQGSEGGQGSRNRHRELLAQKPQQDTAAGLNCRSSRGPKWVFPEGPGASEEPTEPHRRHPCVGDCHP